MEVYEAWRTRPSFDGVYTEAVARNGVAPHAPEGRHVERFVDAL